MGEIKSIQQLIEQSKMTKSEFAKYLGIPFRTIQNWTTDSKNKRGCPDYVISLIEAKLDADGLLSCGFDMKIDKSLIGKVYVYKDDVYTLIGKDFISGEYILRLKVNDMFKGLMRSMSEEELNKLPSVDEAIAAIDEKIKMFERALELYNIFSFKSKRYEGSNALRRLKEVRNHIYGLNMCVKTVKDEKLHKFYERELKKAKKGERRVLKVFYGRLSKEEYDEILEYFDKYPDPHQTDIRIRINSLKRTKEKILKNL